MKYLIYTDYYVTRMYFVEHKGAGFKISMNPEKAKTYDDLKEARLASIELTATTGMKAEVTKKPQIL